MIVSISEIPHEIIRLLFLFVIAASLSLTDRRFMRRSSGRLYPIVKQSKKAKTWQADLGLS